MFTWLNKQGVKSDKGFAVQFTGRFTAEYREGSRTLKVDVEDGFSGGRPCVIVSPAAFKHWDGIPLSDAERQRLLTNFREACEFQGLALVIEP